jgi:branched-chain amino acid aminotransferase
MELDWKNIGFGYLKTDFNVRSNYKNGKWSALEVTSSEFLNIHMAATSLHYGQEAFEGLKAYMGKDGQIRVFRWDENAKRMQSSARGIKMAEVPTELFHEAVIKAVSLNKKYVPPYGTGAALYIRPLLFGSGAEVGVKPAKEYTFLVFVTPVGPYFKEGFKPGNIMICRDFDRAAPMGTGNIKVGGNYAASLNSLEKGHELGYGTVLYLDSKERKYIDECGPANFFAIKNNSYITPESKSILPSITNKCLQTLAADMGMKNCPNLKKQEPAVQLQLSVLLEKLLILKKILSIPIAKTDSPDRFQQNFITIWLQFSVVMNLINMGG